MSMRGQDTPGVFDPDVYESALSSALGSDSGGIAEINDVKTFLPPKVTASDFEDFLETPQARRGNAPPSTGHNLSIGMGPC